MTAWLTSKKRRWSDPVRVAIDLQAIDIYLLLLIGGLVHIIKVRGVKRVPETIIEASAVHTSNY